MKKIEIDISFPMICFANKADCQDSKVIEILTFLSFFYDLFRALLLDTSIWFECLNILKGRLTDSVLTLRLNQNNRKRMLVNHCLSLLVD